jgi:hypothetical protein
MEQHDVVRYVITFLEQSQIPYAVVGSFASTRYGEGRFTNDLDVIVSITRDRIPQFLKAFQAPDWYVSEAAMIEAIGRRSQFNVIHQTAGQKIDFFVQKRLGWWSKQLATRQFVEIIPGLDGYVAHPNDVIIGKLLYYKEGGSEKHVRDIASMLAVSRNLIDVAAIDAQAAELDIADVWEHIKQKVSEIPPPPADFQQ